MLVSKEEKKIQAQKTVCVSSGGRRIHYLAIVSYCLRNGSNGTVRLILEFPKGVHHQGRGASMVRSENSYEISSSGVLGLYLFIKGGVKNTFISFMKLDPCLCVSCVHQGPVWGGGCLWQFFAIFLASEVRVSLRIVLS